MRWGLALLVALLLPTQAAAAPLSPELQQDYQQALTTWGATAPPLCGEVVAEQVPADQLPPDEDGWATMPSAYMPTCALVIAEGLRPCKARVVMRHEVGHLLGVPHSADPQSVMSADNTYPVDWECFPERLQGWADHLKERCSTLAGPHRGRCLETVRSLRRSAGSAAQRGLLVGPPPPLT